jgi:hypothetical protein
MVTARHQLRLNSSVEHTFTIKNFIHHSFWQDIPVLNRRFVSVNHAKTSKSAPLAWDAEKIAS